MGFALWNTERIIFTALSNCGNSHHVKKSMFWAVVKMKSALLVPEIGNEIIGVNGVAARKLS